MFDGNSQDLDHIWVRDGLASPNHKYVAVQATITANDSVDASRTTALVSVTSNEPDNAAGNGDGHTTHDIDIVDKDTTQCPWRRPDLHDHPIVRPMPAETQSHVERR